MLIYCIHGNYDVCCLMLRESRGNKQVSISEQMWYRHATHIYNSHSTYGEMHLLCTYVCVTKSYSRPYTNAFNIKPPHKNIYIISHQNYVHTTYYAIWLAAQRSWNFWQLSVVTMAAYLICHSNNPTFIRTPYELSLSSWPPELTWHARAWRQ